MLTKHFWFGDSGVLVRSIRTFAQTLTAVIGVSTVSVFTVDWRTALGTAGLAAILSILMSLDRNTSTQPQDASVEIARPDLTPTAEPLQSSYSGT